MKISIGLPATIPGVKSHQILNWAIRADASPFHSLGCIDRVVFPNYDPLVVLSAAAAVTQRIRLATTVLLAPLRNPVLLAKQAASLDALSNGRLTLGIGVGSREDDYLATAANFHDRGRRLDAQLAQMKKIWSGAPVAEQVGVIGPPPVRSGGPEILIGGSSDAAIRRIARWGDGFIAGGGAAPGQVQEMAKKIQAAWQAEGRSGQPRLAAAFYCALEPEKKGRAAAYLRKYYAGLGPRVENMILALPLTTTAIQDKIKTYADIGVDELFLWPCIPDLDQLERLAELVA